MSRKSGGQVAPQEREHGFFAPRHLHLRHTEQLGSSQAALGKLSEITHQQAAIMAYNDAFHFVGIALAISMLAVLLTRRLPAGATGGAAH